MQRREEWVFRLYCAFAVVLLVVGAFSGRWAMMFGLLLGWYLFIGMGLMDKWVSNNRYVEMKKQELEQKEPPDASELHH